MPTMDEYRKMIHTNNDPSKADIFTSGRRRGNEKFLRGGLKVSRDSSIRQTDVCVLQMDLLFITGEYSGVVVR